MKIGIHFLIPTILVLTLSGAAAERGVLPMPQGPYSARLDPSVTIPMRDGIKLATDLYFPIEPTTATPLQWGTILLRTPYDKSRYRPESLGRIATMFASHGFTVAIQDVRGKFDSYGTYGVSSHDAPDAYDTIDWIAKQQWSNGKVAMFGCSYEGEAQILAAPLKHPALVALVPRGAGGAVGKAGGRHRFFGAWNGGAFELGLAAKWFPVNGNQIYYKAPDNIPKDLIDMTRLQFTVAPTKPNVDFTLVTSHLPIIDLMQVAGAEHVAPIWKEFITRDIDSQVFDDIGYLHEGQTVATPALHVNSWFDSAVAETLFTFNFFREHAVNKLTAENQYVIISPTRHCESEFVPEHYLLGELDLGDPRIDLWNLYVRWFKYWLYEDGGSLRDLPKVQYYLMGKNVWCSANEWPVPGTKFEKFYLDSNGNANSRFGDGKLSQGEPGDGGMDSFVYDPNTPVPTLGGQSDISGSGSLDQRDIEMRNDVLVYTSDNLEAGIEVVGPLSVKLFVSSSARDTDFTAKLVDVFPDGRALNIQEGILRIRYREGMEKKVWIRAGEICPTSIDLQATAYYFAPQHRIRIEISSSNFPRFDRNMNTGGNTFDETQPQIATNTVHHSSLYPSHLILPILSRQ